VHLQVGIEYQVATLLYNYTPRSVTCRTNHGALHDAKLVLVLYCQHASSTMAGQCTLTELPSTANLYAILISTNDHSTLAEKMDGTMSFMDNVPQGSVMTLRIHQSQSKSTSNLQSQPAECSGTIYSDQNTTFRVAYNSPCSISSSSSIYRDRSPHRAECLASRPQLHLPAANNELLVKTLRILVSSISSMLKSHVARPVRQLRVSVTSALCICTTKLAKPANISILSMTVRSFQ
jgi:hypothetical protein